MGATGRPDCNFGEHAAEFIKLYDDFIGNKNVKKELLDPDEAFNRLVESEFRMPLEFLAFRGDIGKGDVRRLKRSSR